jgi:uncharacterized membrane protein
MENRKLGGIIIIISIAVAFIVFGFMNQLNKTNKQLNCYPNDECQRVESMLTLSHISIGIISFIFALGFYLVLFNRGEEAILERLEQEKNMKLKEDKFSIMLKALDENEKNVLKAVKEQDGVTQSTLKYRTDLSKAKLSQILTDFERKKLIKRELKGKTYSIHLIEGL